MLYWIMSESSRVSGSPSRSKSVTAWKALLILPYIGLCFPQMYMRATPALWGFPFFYWYQFAWVLTTSVILGVVYLKIRRLGT